MVYEAGSRYGFRFFFSRFLRKESGYEKSASQGGGLHSGESGLGGSADGAGGRAGAAFDAGALIDHVLAVAFADGGNGALSGAGAAGDAFIRNSVSHDSYLQFLSRMDTCYSTNNIAFCAVKSK